MKRKGSCTSFFKTLSVLAAGLLVSGGAAWAVSNPSTCTKTGPALLLTELRDLAPVDGIGETPIVGSKVDGETIYYQATLFVSTATGQCAYFGGTLCIDRPGASGCVDVTPVGGIPLLCDNDTICDPDGVAAVDSKQIAYVVNHNDFDTSGSCNQQVRAVAEYHNGTSQFNQGVFPVNADTPICNPVLYCGDGQVDNGEQCDDGNTNNNDGCRNDCTLPFCGDGIKDANEQCDDGNTNNTDSCRNDCTVPFCGDGIKDANEQCDDGNTNNADSCRNDCTVPFCGDGIKDANEQCDDGNTNNADSCRNDCTVPFCGDGIKDANEQCDDGNTNNTDSCANDCTIPPFCGDEILGNTPGETCEPPGSVPVPGDGDNECRQDCTFCGDGHVDAGEGCDDGNQADGDGCSSVCIPEGSAICRTPGFWGTHAFANPKKKGSQNITQAVIDAGGGCLEVCGEVISDTEKNSADSALEAICISIKGDSRLQLARQLTAAALNCVISGGGSDCSGTPLYASLFSTCNSLCADPASVNSDVTSCIGDLDCLNNGGIPLANGQCQKGVCAGNQEPCDGSCSDASVCEPIPGNCHERILVNEDLGLDFDPPGPAGSEGRCSDVVGNPCKVLQPGESKCGSGDTSAAPESCP